MDRKTDEGFPRRQRIVRRSDFGLLYKTGRRLDAGKFVLFVRLNDLGFPRLGLTVSRKVGGAVVRNRVKRLFVIEDVHEARVQRISLALLAVVKRDALGVLAHPHQGKPEVCLVALPLEIERYQPPADQVGQERPDEGVDEAHTSHVSGNADIEADRRQ